MRLSDVLQLPEKTYTPKGNGVQGKIISIGQVTVNGEWSNQQVSLQGLDNTKATITHSSKHPDSMLNQSHIGKDSTWRLKWWFNRNQQRQEISGYPEVKIAGEASQTAQPAPAVSYNASQPAQPANPVASTIVPDGRQGMQMPTTYAYPVTPETQERMARSVGAACAGQVVAAMLQSEWKFNDEGQINGKLLEIADMMAMWITSGTTNASEPEFDTSQVCPSCQLLRVDCTCPTEQFIR